MAYDIGGRGDQSFNDAAAAGLDKAKAELGVETKELAAADGETEPTRRSACSSSPSAGYNPVIAVGFAYARGGRQGRRGVPGHQVRHHRRPSMRPVPTSPTSSSPRSRAPSWSVPPPP